MPNFESRLVSKSFILTDKHDILFNDKSLCTLSINIDDVNNIIEALNSAYALGVASAEKNIALASNKSPYSILSDSYYNILNEEDVDLYVRLPGDSMYGLNHLNTDTALKFIELMNYAHNEGTASVFNISNNTGPSC